MESHQPEGSNLAGRVADIVAVAGHYCWTYQHQKTERRQQLGLLPRLLAIRLMLHSVVKMMMLAPGSVQLEDLFRPNY